MKRSILGIPAGWEMFFSLPFLEKKISMGSSDDTVYQPRVQRRKYLA
jgi:hypothetical protein